MLFHLDELRGGISAAAFNFIVQDPSGIIDWFSERSFLSRDLIYLIIDVSEWYDPNTLSSRKLDWRSRFLGMELLFTAFDSPSTFLPTASEKILTKLFTSSVSLASLSDIENSSSFI